ncbi:MAG: phosphatase PAP2 family protein [Chloroflexi bacterium]|nr:phosphatase PAP2 family protein [Chloroflexota bacterium]
MEALSRVDTAVLLWLNGWVGTAPWLDAALRFLISDYLVPVLLALFLVGMWFAPPVRAHRERYQRAVVISLSGMGFANLAVFYFNSVYFRPRPFEEHPLTLLFYRPTDSSFPANPAVVGFAFAAGVWFGSKRLALVAGTLAALWGFSRVYAGVSYPSDVLVGAVIGIAVTGLFSLAMKVLDPVFNYVLRLAQRLYLA